jgi:nitronate monooxygenase
MSISTALTALLGIQHPVLPAPMDVIAGARLTAAVSNAGGFGILGGGYGDRSWLEAETKKLQGRVPVVAAGGIGDGRGLAVMIALGAAGVLLGTRFYASQECDSAEEAKKRICAATGGGTVRSIIFDLSRNNVWPEPLNGRCLIDDHARRWAGRELELLQNLKTVAAEYTDAKAAGNFDIAAAIAGEAVGLVHDVPPAAEIVDRIVAEADQILLGRRNSSAASRA